MAIMKKSKIREMADAELQARLFEFQKELNSERGLLASGGRTSNPGKIRELRRSVARVLTILHERKMNEERKAAVLVSGAKRRKKRKMAREAAAKQPSPVAPEAKK